MVQQVAEKWVGEKVERRAVWWVDSQAVAWDQRNVES